MKTERSSTESQGDETWESRSRILKFISGKCNFMQNK